MMIGLSSGHGQIPECRWIDVENHGLEGQFRDSGMPDLSIPEYPATLSAKPRAGFTSKIPIDFCRCLDDGFQRISMERLQQQLRVNRHGVRSCLET